MPTILREYGADPTAEGVEQTSQWLLSRMVEFFATKVRVLPGVIELMSALRREGILQALVSSSYRVLVDAVLATGLGPFAVTVAGDEVVPGKPAPEPYLTACSRLRVLPQQCVVLEDSSAGVASGEAAGCAVVAVPSVAAVSFDAASARHEHAGVDRRQRPPRPGVLASLQKCCHKLPVAGSPQLLAAVL